MATVDAPVLDPAPTDHPPSALRRSELRCDTCGYGVVADRAPARCPMCGGTSWRPARYQARLANPTRTRSG